MRKLVEFQILDRNALYYDVDLSKLMDNAGVGIADYIYKNYKKNAKIVFVCGNGNNGGDGYVASSILLGKGFNVTIFQSSTPTSPPQSPAQSSTKPLKQTPSQPTSGPVPPQSSLDESGDSIGLSILY